MKSLALVRGISPYSNLAPPPGEECSSLVIFALQRLGKCASLSSVIVATVFLPVLVSLRGITPPYLTQYTF